MAEQTDNLESLMRQALVGDKKAYGELLKATSRFLRPYLIKRINSETDVDDLMQEILISIHKARHTYDGMRPYKPWVYAIAGFRLKDHLRSRYADHLRQAVDLSEVEKNLAEPVTESGIRYESIDGEIRKLPPKQATILEMMHREGYTAKEVAERIGMKESAVKVAAHRLLDQYRRAGLHLPQYARDLIGRNRDVEGRSRRLLFWME